MPFEGMSNLQAAYAAAFKVSSVVFIISQNSNEILRKHLFQGDLLGWWLYWCPAGVSALLRLYEKLPV